MDETSGPEVTPQANLRDGTAPGRKPPATDAEQRHGRKSKSHRFNGHKASVAVDVDSQLIVGTEVLPGDAADDTELLPQVAAVETGTGLSAALTLGDCAYVSGTRRAELAAAERVLVAKVGQDSPNQGRFTKCHFVVLWVRTQRRASSVPPGRPLPTSRAKKTAVRYSSSAVAATGAYSGSSAPAPGRGGRCGSIPRTRSCRQRALQQTPDGRRLLRERVVVEHGLAQLARLGIGQARYWGRERTRFQLQLAATVANLRRTWNWVAAVLAAFALLDASRAVRAGGVAVFLERAPPWWRAYVPRVTLRQCAARE